MMPVIATRLILLLCRTNKTVPLNQEKTLKFYHCVCLAIQHKVKYTLRYVLTVSILVILQVACAASAFVHPSHLLM
ncbi:hypothetical protein D9742_00145 [Escherichia sp. E1V33]|nr:hypothetical protein D9742_00145 [Escherichia sp. E1V33]TBR68254.1 hypothetical protein D9735_07310 [Escherichia sp. E1S7]